MVLTKSGRRIIISACDSNGCFIGSYEPMKAAVEKANIQEVLF